MIRDFRKQKMILAIMTFALFAADSTMTILSIQVASSMPLQRQLAAQVGLLKLLRADVKRAREIQQDIPKTKTDCEFFENSLPLAGAGYSVISEELQDLSLKAGLQIGSLSFHPRDLTSHGITEITMDASISGDYKSVVQFVSKLQRSKNHYVVDDLTLVNNQGGPGAQAGVRVNLHLRSYLRAVA